MTRHTYKAKRAWVLARLKAEYEHSCRIHTPPQRPWITAVEPEHQEAYEAAFGGKVVYYTVGPKVSPGLARVLRRMWVEGDLRRSTGGNQEARYNCQKTWYVSYSIKR